MPCRGRSGRGRRTTTSGRAAWIWEWMAKAAALSGQVPSTTVPSWSTSRRSLHPDLAEAHAERVDPEVIGQLGVAGGDVSGRALAEPEASEQAEGRGEPLLAMPALVLAVVEAGKACGAPIGWHRPSVRAFVPVSP